MRSWVAGVVAVLLAACGSGGSRASTSGTPVVPPGTTGAGPASGGGGTDTSGTPGSGTGTDGGATATGTGTGTTQPTPTPAPTPPAPSPGLALGDWTFWSVEQGLTPRIEDVSADEAGNVYVAGREAVFAKRRSDAAFARFDAKSAGLTENCRVADPANPSQYIADPNPPVPPSMCPVISVAGGTAGRAFLGFKGVGTDQDKDAPWAVRSGGLDVVTFDGTALKRERHVLVASPPKTVCEKHVCRSFDPTCPHGLDCPCATLPDGSLDYARDANGHLECYPWGTYADGRLKGRQIQRVVVNHRPGIGYGDAIFGGTHGSFSVLVANPDQRGWVDYTTRGDAASWADARYVFEHQHPATTSPITGNFLTGETWAIAIDPRSGVPWFANQFRTTNMPGYASMKIPYEDPDMWEPWWGNMTGGVGKDPQFLTFWRPEGNESAMDAVQSLSFCDDGTLWIGSLTNGLARVSAGADGSVGGFQRIPLPTGFYDRILAVACDLDGTVWIGADTGGILRYDPSTGAFRHGASLFPGGAPRFAAFAPVRSIQIDRWAKPRVVWFAHHDWTSKDASGAAVTNPGGVSAYSGS